MDALRALRLEGGPASGGLAPCQEALVLTLLPVLPVVAPVATVKPTVESGPEIRLLTQTEREAAVGELEAEALEQTTETLQLPELRGVVESVAARRAPRDDEARCLDVPQHPWRPGGLERCGAHRYTLHD
jgi:hypothetical protein